MSSTNPQPQPQPLLKITVLHYRKPGVSEADFMRWIQEDHIQRAARIIQKHNVVHYTQYLTPSSAQEIFLPDLAHKPGWKMADFDAVISYYVRSPDDMRALLSDPEWREEVNAREEAWADVHNVVTMVGWETVYIRDGEVVGEAMRSGTRSSKL
ncbi:hypothetical protein BO94DRAFT_519513 [Aspergillus sclerotioniger CBS 115572]|uniref:EthD domain-containing protein n=1 Tax=Aspergillus sclerotioniger CBS 115572 TaxID=1450535 RepID=A0A317WF89_9EURO|nr:hypothetical protein BO94DRAFT_519513 [Aspergillus sclerotioniger CBS 115572]PWY83907.1 hypothetical protein BO94DRAFT_519513 [Aspergillus sclerotioniger CBS 115572]